MAQEAPEQIKGYFIPSLYTTTVCQ